mmetsp:Transcript_16416/g.23892  ORF Transcript_16416/g.23892 Transcript_16416/m.23892 type:complete len:117 (-) Transcript_16416:1430-1780(-)
MSEISLRANLVKRQWKPKVTVKVAVDPLAFSLNGWTIAAKATLAAQKQYSQDTSGLLKQHIEIFSQIAKASTESVLDAVKTALLSVSNNNGAATGSTLSQQLQNRQLLQISQQVSI